MNIARLLLKETHSALVRERGGGTPLSRSQYLELYSRVSNYLENSCPECGRVGCPKLSRGYDNTCNGMKHD